MTSAPTRVLSLGRKTWTRRVTFRGFLRRQRVAAVAAWVSLALAIASLLGLRGPVVEIQVLKTFYVYPLPLAVLLAGLGVAALCIGVGSSPLPRRRQWPVAVVAVLILLANGWLALNLPGSTVGAALRWALGLSLVCLAVGVATRRLGWGMVGFAVCCAVTALLLVDLQVAGGGRPAIGSGFWYLAMATHQVSYGLGYLTFLVVTIVAPVGLLTGTAERFRRARAWSELRHHPRRFAIGCVLIALLLAGWSQLWHPGRSGWQWLFGLVAAAAVIGCVFRTAAHPLLDLDERKAGFWIAVVVCLPYVALTPVFAGVGSETVYRWAVTLTDWKWSLLLAGVLVLWLLRRRLTVGTALLGLATLVECARRFLHVAPDLLITVSLIVATVGCYEAAALFGWRVRDGRDALTARLGVGLARVAVLALLVVGLAGLIPDGFERQLLYGLGAVAAAVAVLLIGQPGRDLPPPGRGAAYVRAAGWAVVVIAAQGVMLAVRGLDIVSGSQSEAAALLTLPLLVVYAGFRQPQRQPAMTTGP